MNYYSEGERGDMPLDDDVILNADGWAVERYARHRENALVNFKWWVFGMPPVDELRARYTGGPFTDEEEDRIRKIVRDEIDSGD